MTLNSAGRYQVKNFDILAICILAYEMQTEKHWDCKLILTGNT